MTSRTQCGSDCLNSHLDAVGHADRRQVLNAVRRSSPRELSAAVSETSSPQAGAGEISPRMYHLHLPKLAAMDLIEWDRDTNRVARGPDFEIIVPLLEQLEAYRGSPDAG